MTTAAEICRCVIEEKNPLVDAVFDRVGVSGRIGDALLNKLCRDGLVKRSGDSLVVGWNHKATEELAREAGTAVAKETPTPKLPGTPARAKLRLIPIPTTIEVRSGIPCPPPRTGRTKRDIPWPFAQMAPGDSFAIVVPEGFTAREVAQTLSRDVAMFRKSTVGFRAAVRIAADEKSVGVWREADLTTEANVATGCASSLGLRSRKANGAAKSRRIA